MSANPEIELMGCRNAARIAAFLASKPSGWHFALTVNELAALSRNATALWTRFDEAGSNEPPGYTWDRVHGFLHESGNSRHEFLQAQVMPIRDHRKHYLDIAKAAEILLAAFASSDELEDQAIHWLWPLEDMQSRLGKLFDDMGMDGTDQKFQMPRSALATGRVMGEFAEASPTMADVLRQIIARCEDLARIGPLDTRPANKQAACRRYVIRRLSKWLRTKAGSPLHGELADVVNVMFPGLDAVDSIYVQKTARPPETSV